MAQRSQASTWLGYERVATELAGGPERPGEPATRVIADDARAAALALELASRRPRLIYLDPPFAVERDFHVAPRAVQAGEGRVAYSDKWPTFEAYVAFVREVVEAAYELLAPDGSLLLHCDYRAAPNLALVCDAIFGRGDRAQRGSAGFRNELVWSYGLGGSSPRCYPKKHDTIYWYSKSTEWVFEPPLVPATSVRMAGKLKKAPDVLAIPSINNMASERTGYPTQKPLALLELLVRAHSEPGDLVVDLFSGSGTTAAAAVRNGRDAWVADSGAEGVGATTARLVRDGCAVSVYVRRADEEAVAQSVGRWLAALGVAKSSESR